VILPRVAWRGHREGIPARRGRSQIRTLVARLKVRGEGLSMARQRFALLLCMMLLSLFVDVVPAATPRVFPAQGAESAAWTPLPGMALRVTASGSFRLQGRREEAWAYMRSADFPLEAGHKYRFSARVRVMKSDPRRPPFLEVRAVGAGKTLAWYGTTHYDLTAGGWQRLWVEFECPTGTRAGWVAMEKNTDLPISLEAEIREAAVDEIDKLTLPHEYRFHPVPAPLARLSHTHPRLYLTQTRLVALRSKLGQEPYAGLLARLRYSADRLVAKGPPAFREHDSDEEQLWQRGVGNALPTLALVYLLTEDKRYLAATQAWMLASAGYPTWGLNEIDGTDLAAGHQLFGLALAYDWLYADLDAATRDTVRACLQRRGRQMYEPLVRKQLWWSESYLQNHQWIDMTGLAAAGLALYGEAPDVDGWVLVPLEKAHTVMRSLGADGASHEGVPYWGYGIDYLLRFMDLARDLLGTDLFARNAWFRNTADFRLYSMLPRSAWRPDSDLMNFGDGPRTDWGQPDFILHKLAAEYREPYAQWLGNEVAKDELYGWETCFLDLLWLDPSVPAEPPARRPTFRHFSDLDLVFMRSSWAGDEAAAAFKCGPPLGHHVLSTYDYDPGAGHVHPDAGSLLLFAHGDWLLVDDGYARKQTDLQNTLVVNGVGQEGEGSSYFSAAHLQQEKRGARVLRATHGEGYDYVIGDAAPAYRPEAGLTRFLRHLIYLRPDCWVLVDEVAARSPSTFALSYHADFPFVLQADGSFLEKGPRGALEVTCLAPHGVVAKSWQQVVIGTGGTPEGKLETLTVSNAAPQTSTVFVTVLNARSADAAARPRPSLQPEGDGLALTVETGDATWRLVLQPGRRDPASPILASVTTSH
jgi:hypothetical protein